MGHLQQVISELKNRRVIRALVVWGIVAFAVLQVYEPVMHGLHLPEWTLSFVVVVLGLGFPVLAVLSWEFDLTARGIERTRPPQVESDDPPPASPSRGPRLALLLLGLGCAAAGPGLVYFFVWPGSPRRPVEASAAGRAVPGAPSVAVLPFVDMSPNKDQEYFSDGITEEILQALARVDGLRVPGRTSSFWFKGKNARLAEIGRELNVGSVLEGSVRKDGNRIRITAQLLSVGDGNHLWSETFDRELTDVFRIQDEISRAVAAALQVRLLPGVGGRGRGRSTGIEAYNQYLLGRQLLSAGSRASLQGAREAFARAVAIDPGYAPAHAGLARAFGAAAGFLPETPEDVIRYAQLELASAERAIALDPDLPDGYVARAAHRLGYAWDWSGGLSDIERAIALRTGDKGADIEHSLALAALGRTSEGLSAARRATEVDPLSVDAWTNLARLLVYSGDFLAGEGAARRGLQISPDNPVCGVNLGFALLGEGKPAEALDLFGRNSFDFFRLLGQAIAHHELGNTRESQAALDELIAKESLIAAYQIADVYAARGERDAAFEWLERARVQHDEGLLNVRNDNLFRSLHEDPRWKPFLRRMGLPVD